MSDRSYRALVGLLLLVALYLDRHALILGLAAVMFFEGLTNLRIPRVVNRLLDRPPETVPVSSAGPARSPVRFRFEAERAWRLVVPAMLLLSLYPFSETLWFFPWFMGFAILGAGLSDVCPVLLLLRYLGFR